MGHESMGPEPSDRLTITVVADIPLRGVRAFQEYEAAVLPLLGDHGGRLRHRYRNADGTVEVHIIEFESHAGYESYLADERRSDHRPTLRSSGANTRAFVVEAVL